MYGSECQRCGTTGKGRTKRRSAVATCSNYECGVQVCEKHSIWYDDGYLCTRCARNMGINVSLR
jgi:hypothetical protein